MQEIYGAVGRRGVVNIAMDIVDETPEETDETRADTNEQLRQVEVPNENVDTEMTSSDQMTQLHLPKENGFANVNTAPRSDRRQSIC